MRCFIAVDLDPALKAKVVAIQKELNWLDAKLVEPENLHFTLKFLGEVDMKTVDEVRRRLTHLASQTAAVEIDIEGMGCFPSDEYIRVVWIGSEKLTPLQQAVNDAMKGIVPSEKPVPHLTLARARSQNNRQELLDFINKRRKIVIGQMKVNNIKLKKSVVTSKGPEYTDLEIYHLA